MEMKEMYLKEIKRIKKEIYCLLDIAKSIQKDESEEYEKTKNFIQFGEKLAWTSAVSLIQNTIDRIEFKIPWEE